MPKNFTTNEKLDQFYFSRSETTFHSCNLIMKVIGNDFKSLRNKILNKILKYNPLIHPKKNNLVHFSYNVDNFEPFFEEKSKSIFDTTKKCFTEFKDF